MAETFQILTGFLERYGNEVEGRELQEPPEEMKIKLQQLARGKLPEREQSDLFALLSRNPPWVARLAQEVKALRTARV
jgi:hypothetical protein